MSGGGGFSLTFCTQGVVRMVFSLPRARVSINRGLVRPHRIHRISGSCGSGPPRSGDPVHQIDEFVQQERRFIVFSVSSPGKLVPKPPTSETTLDPRQVPKHCALSLRGPFLDLFFGSSWGTYLVIMFLDGVFFCCFSLFSCACFLFCMFRARPKSTQNMT